MGERAGLGLGLAKRAERGDRRVAGAKGGASRELGRAGTVIERCECGWRGRTDGEEERRVAAIRYDWGTEGWEVFIVLEYYG